MDDDGDGDSSLVFFLKKTSARVLSKHVDASVLVVRTVRMLSSLLQGITCCACMYACMWI